MYTDKIALELVDLIYAAAGDPGVWSVLLERLGKTFQCSAGSLHSQVISTQEASVGASWGIDPFWVGQYVDHYCQINPCFLLGKALIQPGSVHPRQAFCPDGFLRGSEFFNDYMEEIDIFEGIVATILEDSAGSANLTIFRSKNNEPFSNADFELMRVLMPHLQQALLLHNRIQGLETRHGTAFDALDHLDQGVVLLDAGSTVLFVNRSATALFATEKSLALTSRGLVAKIPSEKQHLNRLIQGTISTGNGKGLHEGGAIAISRGGVRRPLQLLVTPLRAKTIHLDQHTPVVAIFISDPDRKPVSNAAVFTQLFGLTPAEARLAQLLAAGSDLKEASERLGVLKSTLRSHLKSIFAKTNTNRQSQLVRLLGLTPGGDLMRTQIRQSQHHRPT